MAIKLTPVPLRGLSQLPFDVQDWFRQLFLKLQFTINTSGNGIAGNLVAFADNTGLQVVDTGLDPIGRVLETQIFGSS